MIKLFIESIKKNIEIENGIYHVILENPITYRNIAISIDSEIILSIDNKVFDLSKESIIVYNPFNIDLNETRIIKALYKNLDKTIHENYIDDLAKIEVTLFNISEKINDTTNASIEYDSQIDISKLLACVGIKYKYSKDYLNNLLQYILINIELFFKKIFIIFGLSTVLNETEIKFLNDELTKLGASIIDISFSTVNNNNSTLIIDEDWCIL